MHRSSYSHRDDSRSSQLFVFPFLCHFSYDLHSFSARPNEDRLSFQTIRVTGITRNVLENHIREIFGRYGTITSCHFPINQLTNAAQGFTIITYESTRAAQAAFDEMNQVNTFILFLFLCFCLIGLHRRC